MIQYCLIVVKYSLPALILQDLSSRPLSRHIRQQDTVFCHHVQIRILTSLLLRAFRGRCDIQGEAGRAANTRSQPLWSLSVKTSKVM